MVSFITSKVKVEIMGDYGDGGQQEWPDSRLKLTAQSTDDMIVVNEGSTMRQKRFKVAMFSFS